MPQLPCHWQVLPAVNPPPWFEQAVAACIGSSAPYTAMLLWQRGICSPEQVAGFLNPECYQPASPFEFAQEMQWAIERLQQAHINQEKVAIWGDFDADGLTATAVLWEGLGYILNQANQLGYYIPNRFTESHGLSVSGINMLKADGYKLIVTCDTGCSNLHEIAHARQIGLDVIITDHHTLPRVRPPANAVINPRSLSRSHPLAHLSGVAVAYKLVEALYQTLNQPLATLEQLLDLVAIGLIADLVELTGDCRYLAQRGIQRLQLHTQGELEQSTRPGVAYLLNWCKKNGDRPTDISFGLGPRINAISRIHGDARLGVELLTSRNLEQCYHLAEQAELANARRKGLQKQVVQQVTEKLTQIDLSTTRVIVLEDSQWPVGILGLVAGQIAQTYNRPTVLLSTEGSEDEPLTPVRLARGSARSIATIDLYQLVQGQEHLLHRFGGHPLAMGLSLPIENIPLFASALNRQLLQHFPAIPPPTIQVDLVITVAELVKGQGKELFRQLRLLEPCGMGNPVPKLLVRNGWFSKLWQQRTISDAKKQAVGFSKLAFELWDDTAEQGFPGVWWGHYQEDIPPGRCDAIVELDFNPGSERQKPRYEIRLVAVRSHQANVDAMPLPNASLLDWRVGNPAEAVKKAAVDEQQPAALVLRECPTSWNELQVWQKRAQDAHQPLAIAYEKPCQPSPDQLWQQFVGLAKYLSRTGMVASHEQISQKLGLSPRLMEIGLQCLQAFGFTVVIHHQTVQFSGQPANQVGSQQDLEAFRDAICEEQFRKQYFYQTPVEILQG
jgi:single-stranded-DNA-specific exonuclease